MNRSDVFVSPKWLLDHLCDDRVVVVDGSWHMPATQRSGRAEYLAAHIPGAVFFDLDAVADQTTDLPHMLPTADAFAAAVGALGIADDATIVVYDVYGLRSAARVRWTFRVMGAADVRILEGGLPAWQAAGYGVEAGEASRPAATFAARLDVGAVRSFAEVMASLGSPTIQIADARSAGRFHAREPEPRAGLKSGHMPGAVNVPFEELIDGDRLKSAQEVARVFASHGIDIARPVITSCGSGVTAAILSLGLETIGAADVALYDGSWTEWGGRPESVVVSD